MRSPVGAGWGSGKPHLRPANARGGGGSREHLTAAGTVRHLFHAPPFRRQDEERAPVVAAEGAGEAVAIEIDDREDLTYSEPDRPGFRE